MQYVLDFFFLLLFIFVEFCADGPENSSCCSLIRLAMLTQALIYFLPL